ncbi:MAG TPA: hypothetical protein VLK23_17400 [Thermodesulfobacteriota bacterium]|nr:hypothetical protein [Thermodesulfobacteriota bacterium]
MAISLLLAAVLSEGSFTFAEDAMVLPKGVFRGNLDGRFYWPVDKRYGAKGNLEDLAVDYNNRTLDSTAFPSLSLVEKAFGMAPGSANIGKSLVSFQYEFTDLFVSFMYGVTDRLTAGITLPYYWQRNNVRAKLVTLKATVGKNSDLNTLAPLSLPGTVPLTTRDVLNLLGGGLDINGDGTIDVTGYGYKRFKTWSEKGVGDLEVGTRYQYFKNDKWRLAFTGGVRLPTGELDDPDNLVDLDFGSGAYAFLFCFNHDYTAIRNLVLNATFEYDLILPRRTTLRIPDDVNLPLTSNRENVKRNIGDIMGLKLFAEYTLFEGLSASLLYHFEGKMKDKVNGSRGFRYHSVEEETNYRSHVYVIGLSYSTLPIFLAKKFPVPLCIVLAYRDRFAGKNNVLNTQYIHLGLQIFF